MGLDGDAGVGAVDRHFHLHRAQVARLDRDADAPRQRQVGVGGLAVVRFDFQGEGLFGPRALQEQAAAGQRRDLVVHDLAHVSATLLAAACEAFVAGAKAGLDPITMTRILGIETGRNFASSRVLPEQVATRTFAYGKSLGAALNDLDFVADEARRLGVTTWVLDGTRSLYRLAAGLGGGGEDMSRLATYYEAWAGAEVRIPAPGDQKQGK
ncbi:hypothetical protein E2I21_11400 [Alcaligenaceae bacterium SAGV5]|nr:hypothetical protein [Alcaligenaceae bacterium SAGV5]